MKNLFVTCKDPIAVFDAIMNDIDHTQAGDINAIIADPLRGSISEIYGINMNMIDTHGYIITFPDNSSTMPLIIYEGKSEDIDVFKERVEYGLYEDCYLLGCLDKAYRDDIASFDFFDKQAYANDIIDIALNICTAISRRFGVYREYDGPTNPYIEYMCGDAGTIVTAKRCSNRGFTIKDLAACGTFWFGNSINAISDQELNALYKAASKYRYATTEKLYLDIVDKCVKYRDDKLSHDKVTEEEMPKNTIEVEAENTNNE